MNKRPIVTLPDHIGIESARLHPLPAGMPLYVLPAGEQPVVRLSFVFRAGTACQRIPFSASAAANLLSDGSRALTAQQTAERLDFYGSWYDASVDRDYAYISFCCLTKFLAPTLEVAEQILLHPIFPQDEFDTYRAKRRQALTLERRKTDMLCREAFGCALFGAEHPYGISSPESLYDELERTQVEAFYRRFYTASNALAVCTGRIGEPELEAISALVTRFAAGDGPAAPAFPPAHSTPCVRVEQPGALQSAVRVGRRLFPRTHPDFVGMQTLATLLGGYFGSRLMHNLREERGYTYGVFSTVVNLARDGYLAVATQVAAEATRDTLRQIYAEIERLRSEPVPAAELEMVKNIMAGEMMRILDGPFGIADVTIENLLCGRDNGAIAETMERIRSLTPADMQRLAQQYLPREALVEAVAGDEAVL